jgi:Mg2+/citrate symporter
MFYQILPPLMFVVAMALGFVLSYQKPQTQEERID